MLSYLHFSILYVLNVFVLSLSIVEHIVLKTELKIQRFNYSQFLKSRQISNVEPGYRFDNVLIADFDIGENNPTFKMSLETGVSKAFAFDKDYEGTNRQHTWPTYNHEASNTSIPKNEDFEVTTGGIKATGKSFFEVLHYFGMKSNQTVGSVMEFPFPQTYQLDGVVGLCWDPDSERQPGPDASFSVNLLQRYPPHMRLFNIIVNECYGLIQWGRDLGGDPLPVHSVGGIPAIYINQIKFGNYENYVKTSAIVDTGYSTLSLPSAFYRQVLKTVNPTTDPSTGLLVVDCGDNSVRPPKFVFTIGTEKYEVTERHYILERDLPNDKCVLAVSQSPDNAFRLGMPFIRTVDLTFRITDNTISIRHRPVFPER